MPYPRLALFFCCIQSLSLYGERSIYRPVDSNLPEIRVSYVGKDSFCSLRSPYLEYWPIFKTFDREYAFEHLLPRGEIAYREDPTQSISGEELSRIIKEFVQLVRRSRRIKKEMGRFIILKSCDFNPRTSAGLIVARCKDHPFVIKLFMETPESFVKPFSKGFEPGCLFIIGGGVSRYLAGFTRVKNADYMRAYFEAHPLWRGILDLPRKWFLFPDDAPWLVVRGYNIGCDGGVREIELPSVYVIVCDAINFERRLTLRNRHERHFALAITQELDNRLDPHIANFVIETRTGNIVIVDTEHFPTMIGLRKPLRYKSYGSWYIQLFLKGFCARFCRTKHIRKSCQREEPSPLLRV